MDEYLLIGTNENISKKLSLLHACKVIWKLGEIRQVTEATNQFDDFVQEIVLLTNPTRITYLRGHVYIHSIFIYAAELIGARALEEPAFLHGVNQRV